MLLLALLWTLSLSTLAPRVLQPLIAFPVLSIVLLVTLPLTVGESAARHWLASRYDRSTVTDDLHPAGILIAGGGLWSFVTDQQTGQPLDDRSRGGRISGAVHLAARFPDAKIVYTGRGEEAAREVLIGLGLAGNRIVIEANSSNTYENARNAAALLQPKLLPPWVLVTSAIHMPRALATFRSAGFHVLAYPVDMADIDQANVVSGRTSPAAHELIALVGYVVTGRVSMIEGIRFVSLLASSAK